MPSLRPPRATALEAIAVTVCSELQIPMDECAQAVATEASFALALIATQPIDAQVATLSGAARYLIEAPVRISRNQSLSKPGSAIFKYANLTPNGNAVRISGA